MRYLIGTLALALAAACGSSTASREPAMSPELSTGGVEQGALPVGQTTTTGQVETAAQTQGATGQAMPNNAGARAQGAGANVETASPGGHAPRILPRPVVPPSPMPINTGDPCGPCGPPPGR